MLKIRLKRTGKKHQPHYRIVVTDASRKRDGEAIEQVGYYNPRTEPSTITLEKERIAEWLKKGAQPTETIERILVKEGLMKKAKKGSKLGKQIAKKKSLEKSS